METIQVELKSFNGTLAVNVDAVEASLRRSHVQEVREAQTTTTPEGHVVITIRSDRHQVVQNALGFRLANFDVEISKLA